MKHTIARILTSGAAAGSILFSGAAAAIDWNVTGFVRQEISYSLATSENPNNDVYETSEGSTQYNDFTFTREDDR